MSVAEGDSGPKTVNLTASLTEVETADYPVTVSYATADGTAGPANYTAKSGTITFDLGETTKTVSVDVAGDTTPEPAERSTCGSRRRPREPWYERKAPRAS